MKIALKYPSLVLIVTTLLLGCSKGPNNSEGLSLSSTSSSEEIIGGDLVSDSDSISRSTVALYDEAKGALCTGSLLSDQIVLTAGHCVVDSNTQSLIVIFGLDASGKASQTIDRRVVEASVNPVYVELLKRLKAKAKTAPSFETTKDQGDVALVKFTGGLPEGYRPATLVTDPSALIDGATVTLAGYGITNGVTKAGAGILRKTNVTLTDAHFSNSEVLFDQTDGHGACHGDSGGPAFISVDGEALLFGITSRGHDDANNDCTHSAIYTTVLGDQAFIQNALQQLSAN